MLPKQKVAGSNPTARSNPVTAHINNPETHLRSSGNVPAINTSQYWDCDLKIKADHFLCYAHYVDWEDELLGQCQNRGRVKDVRYDLCLDCHHGR